VIAFVKDNGMMELGLVTQGIAIVITFVGRSQGEVHLSRTPSRGEITS
jgi:hypothetical protein